MELGESRSVKNALTSTGRENESHFPGRANRLTIDNRPITTKAMNREGAFQRCVQCFEPFGFVPIKPHHRFDCDMAFPALARFKGFNARFVQHFDEAGNPLVQWWIVLFVHFFSICKKADARNSLSIAEFYEQTLRTVNEKSPDGCFPHFHGRYTEALDQPQARTDLPISANQDSTTTWRP